MKTVLSILLVVLPLLGIADAGYLTYEKLSGRTPPCSVGSDCGAVLNSPYASIGSIPLSSVGLLFYSFMFILTSTYLLEIDLGKLLGEKIGGKLKHLRTIDFLLMLSTFAVLFSAYLIFLMGVIIGAWCQYCLISALVSFLIWVTTMALYLQMSESAFVALGIWYAVFGFVYQNIVKPIFFVFDPEFIHDLHTLAGRMIGSMGVTRSFTAIVFRFKHPVIESTFDGIRFPNPVGLSAGFDYDGHLTGILPSVGFGFHTIGTATFQPYDGNEPPRLGRFPDSKALLVNKGLKTMGIPALLKHLGGRKFAIPTGISIASTNTSFADTKAQILDILHGFQACEQSSVQHSYYELNISCPNTFGGEPFTSADRLEILLTCIDGLHLSRPLYIKMPIDQSEHETAALLAVANQHNVQGVIFGNLTKDRSNPAVTPADQASWKEKKGNLSGKPTWERSNAHIAFTKKKYGKRFTIIGTGGIFSGEDALEKMRLGADLVQLITGMIFQGPQVLGSISRTIALKKLQ